MRAINSRTTGGRRKVSKSDSRERPAAGLLLPASSLIAAIIHAAGDAAVRRVDGRGQESAPRPSLRIFHIFLAFTPHGCYTPPRRRRAVSRRNEGIGGRRAADLLFSCLCPTNCYQHPGRRCVPPSQRGDRGMLGCRRPLLALAVRLCSPSVNRASFNNSAYFSAITWPAAQHRSF